MNVSREPKKSWIVGGLLLSVVTACSPFTDFCKTQGDCAPGELCDFGTCTPSRSAPDYCKEQNDFARCQVTTLPDREYDICVDGACVSPGCGGNGCNSPGQSFILPDTNQTSCYDDGEAELEACPGPEDPFYGQDSQYRREDDGDGDGVPRFQRIMKVSHEPVVKDNITLLDWQGCRFGMFGENCEMEVGEETFKWTDAVTECDRLKWGGFEDWRLPDEFELYSIVDKSANNPAIDWRVFPEELTYPNFWSSSTSIHGIATDWAILVSFSFGEFNHDDKTMAHRVRCVRAAQAPLAAKLPDPSLGRFKKSVPLKDQPLVEDRITGLHWQGCSAGQTSEKCNKKIAASLSWEESLKHCESSDWGGKTDWRLPNINELRSIAVNDRSPAIDGEVFVSTGAESYWSSTTASFNPLTAWAVDFKAGFVRRDAKNSRFYVRCVRGGP